MHTLKNVNKKLLADKNKTIDKLKNQFDQTPSLSKSQYTEGLKNVYNLEQQINSLVKSITRAENMIEEKDKLLRKPFLFKIPLDKLNKTNQKNMLKIEKLCERNKELEEEYDCKIEELKGGSKDAKTKNKGMRFTYNGTIEIIKKLTLEISESKEYIKKLEEENLRIVELGTEKEMAEKDLKKARNELLEVKVE